MPAAAQGFDQLHRRDQSLAGQLCIGAFSGQSIAARIDHVDITHNAGTIALIRKISGAARVIQRALAGRGFIGEVTNSRKTVFHIAKSHEHLLAIARDGFIK